MIKIYCICVRNFQRIKKNVLIFKGTTMRADAAFLTEMQVGREQGNMDSIPTERQPSKLRVN